MEVKEINIEGILDGREDLNICSLQLYSPFPSSLQVSEAMGNKILSWKPKGLKENKLKINTILANLEKIMASRKIDILVFPEYCGDITFKNDIKDFSHKHNTIIVFNYYLPDSRSNISNIIFPDGQEFSQYKLNPSEYDREFLSAVDEPNKITYKFNWNSRLGKSYFQVLTCFDFLSLSLETVDYESPGIIIVPMSSSEINEFEGLSSYIIRKGSACDINRAIVLTNSVTDRKFITKKKDFKGFCGFSQIVAHNKLRIKLPRFQESALIATVNPSNTSVNPTPIDRENSAVYGEISYNIDSQGIFSEFKVVNSKGYAINPNVIRYLNLQKFYVFYKVDKYNKAKFALQKTTLGCSGVFGVHDLLIKSYEEQFEFLDIRISHQLGRKKELLHYAQHYIIDEIFKFRGEILCSDTGGFDHLKTPGLADYMSKNKELIRKLLIGQDLKFDCEEDLVSKGILLTGTGESDITSFDKNEGKEEYLVFILFEEKDFELLAKNVQKFKSHILPILISDPRIRTIEFSGANISSPTRNGCCICHLVGYLDDIREVVLCDLHHNMCQYEIEYGTRLVPIAETLSKNKYNSIIETSINDLDTRDTVLELLHYMKDYPDVFIIKKLPHDVLNDICKIFIEFKSWILETDGINGEFGQTKRRLLHNVDEFIYGFSYELIMRDDPSYDQDVFPDHSARFVHQIYKILEKILYSKIIKLADEIGRDKFLELVNSERCKDKKEGLLNFSFNQTTLGKTTKLISCWNNKFYKDHGYIASDSFHLDCNRLQGFTNFRNNLSHTDIDKPEKINSSVLSEVLKAICFIRKYYS